MTRRYWFVFIVSFTLADCILAAPSVISISPASQSTSANRNVQIVVSCDGPMDVSTLNVSDIMILGKWSGVISGSFQIENNNSRARFTPSTLFSAGEWVTVSISKAVKNQVSSGVYFCSMTAQSCGKHATVIGGVRKLLLLR